MSISPAPKGALRIVIAVRFTGALHGPVHGAGLPHLTRDLRLLQLRPPIIDLSQVRYDLGRWGQAKMAVAVGGIMNDIRITGASYFFRAIRVLVIVVCGGLPCASGGDRAVAGSSVPEYRSPAAGLVGRCHGDVAAPWAPAAAGSCACCAAVAVVWNQNSEQSWVAVCRRNLGRDVIPLRDRDT